MRLSQKLLTGNYKSGFERNISEITINEIQLMGEGIMLFKKDYLIAAAGQVKREND